jgi:hypothetical protein
MIDWIGAENRFHAVVDGHTACGCTIGGATSADHPCEHCVDLLFGMLESVPGLEAVDA